MNANSTSSPMAANSQYRPVIPQQAVATLLLIENSENMSYIWPDLRDRYLQSVMSKFDSSNPAIPVKAFIMESLSADGERTPALPRQYSALRVSLDGFQFNYDPRNRLSVGKIASSTDILTSIKFQGQHIARHLIIVAASTPVVDVTSANLSSYSGRSAWHRLAQKCSQANIQCHMVLGPNEDMAPLMTLFEETLRLQNHFEEQPLFPVDRTKVLFRLSAKSNHNFLRSAAPYSDTVLPRRNHTFPSDSYSHPDDVPKPSEILPDVPPSLVSQLQQVHGLTKKKVYGTKPARLPFFREERVREKQHGTTAAHTTSKAPSPIATLPSGRAVSRTRADRIARVAGGSPTESHPRRQHGSRRGSRLSSPEADGTIAPAPYPMPSLSPPILPAKNVDAYIPPSGNLDAADLKSREVAEPTWFEPQYPPAAPLAPQTQYPLVSITAQLPQPSRSDVQWYDDQSTGSSYSHQTAFSVQPLISHNIQTLHPKISPTIEENPAASGASSAANHTPNRTRPPRVTSPEDEIPFTFDDEYVAATTALFNTEVLPAYPNFAAMSEPVRPAKHFNPPPARSFYFNTDQDSLPPSPSSPSYLVGEIYVPMIHQDDMLHYSRPHDYVMDSPLAYSTSYSPGSSSSLTGWAG